MLNMRAQKQPPAWRKAQIYPGKYLLVVPEKNSRAFIDPSLEPLLDQAKIIDYPIKDARGPMKKKLKYLYKGTQGYYIPRQAITGLICVTALSAPFVGLTTLSPWTGVALGLAFIPSAYVHGDLIARKGHMKLLLSPPNAEQTLNVFRELERYNVVVVRMINEFERGRMLNIVTAGDALRDLAKVYLRTYYGINKGF